MSTVATDKNDDPNAQPTLFKAWEFVVSPNDSI